MNDLSFKGNLRKFVLDVNVSKNIVFVKNLFTFINMNKNQIPMACTYYED